MSNPLNWLPRKDYRALAIDPEFKQQHFSSMKGVIGHDGLQLLDILRAVLQFLIFKEYGFTVFQSAISVQFYGFNKALVWLYSFWLKKILVFWFFDPPMTPQSIYFRQNLLLWIMENYIIAPQMSILLKLVHPVITKVVICTQGGLKENYNTSACLQQNLLIVK